MKKIVSVFSFLIIGFGVFLWFAGNEMREIRTEIEIGAPPAKVWSLLMDFGHWKEWNPIVKQASGKASLGSELNITMRGGEGQDGPNYLPVVTHLDEPKFFRWRGKMMAEFVMTNDKVFELEETASGTRLVHKEMFSGMFVPLMWGKFESGVPPMLNSMNEALKALAERSSD